MFVLVLLLSPLISFADDKVIADIIKDNLNFIENKSSRITSLKAVLDFNIKDSDALFLLALESDLSLSDKLYVLESALNYNNFKKISLEVFFNEYYKLLLLKNNSNSNLSILKSFFSLDEERQKNRELLLLALKACENSPFKELFYESLFKKAWFLYKKDASFFPYFTQNDRYFEEFLPLLEQHFQNFKEENSSLIESLFLKSSLNDKNTKRLFAFLKTQISSLKGLEAFYLLKYELISQEEAFKAFKDFPPLSLIFYEGFYNLLSEDLKEAFSLEFKNLSGNFLLNPSSKERKIVQFSEGKLLKLSVLSDFDIKAHEVFFNDSLSLIYENLEEGYKVSYSLYPYVETIEAFEGDFKVVYKFSANSYKYEIFKDPLSQIDFNEGVESQIFLANNLNLEYFGASPLEIRNKLVKREKYKNNELIEESNYLNGTLVSVYKKLNGALKFNYIELYERGSIVKTLILLDDKRDNFVEIEH